MPPVTRYPSRSDGAVAVLCPLGEALVAGLVKDPIGLGDRAVSMEDSVTVGSLGTRLQGTTAQALRGAVSHGQVEQQGCPIGPDHTGLGNKPSSAGLSIAQEGGEATGRDQLDHRSGARGGGGVSLSLEHILQHRGHLPRGET